MTSKLYYARAYARGPRSISVLTPYNYIGTAGDDESSERRNNSALKTLNFYRDKKKKNK